MIKKITQEELVMFGLQGAKSAALWATVVQYYATNFRCFDMPVHCHGAWEIMLVVSGSAHISWYRSGGTHHHRVMHEGEYIVLESGLWHRLQVFADCPCRMLNLELCPTAPKGMFSLESLALDPDFQNQSFFFSTDREATLHSCILSLQQQLRRNSTAPENDWILGQLMLCLARAYGEKFRQPLDPYVQQAEDFIALHFDRDIAVAQIAAHIGLSRAYLQRLYKKHTGLTLVEKINQLRIEKAKFLLHSSSLSVVDVAINVGFNNRQHFSQIFHSLIGLSPGSYKKLEGNR